MEANKKSIEEHEETKQNAYKATEEIKLRLKQLEDEEHIIKTILQKSTISDGADCKYVGVKILILKIPKS